VIEAARVAAATGHVDGITLHLREDRRHVQDADIRRVREELALPFNFEMSTAEEIVLCCLDVAPGQATLVPERREEVTTEGGLDLARSGDRVGAVTRRLQAAGIQVSLFIDPEPDAIARAAQTGATHVELHTGRYADAADAASRARELDHLVSAAAAARRAGLEVNAGHGLTVGNVPLVARIAEIQDLNIGHAIVARALFLGLPGALAEMAAAIRSAV
jgi:pyridoxine 5-phosphate synthase